MYRITEMSIKTKMVRFKKNHTQSKQDQINLDDLLKVLSTSFSKFKTKHKRLIDKYAKEEKVPLQSIIEHVEMGDPEIMGRWIPTNLGFVILVKINPLMITRMMKAFSVAPERSLFFALGGEPPKLI